MWPETYKILTVSIAGRSTKVVRPVGMASVPSPSTRWPEIPKTDEEVAVLKKYVYSDPNLRGILVSRDGKSAIVLTQFKTDISYQRAFEILSALDEKYTDEDTEIYLVGFPVLMGWIYSYKAQIMAVMAVSVFVMIAVLFLSFQNLVGMVVPVLFGLISTAMGLGFIGWTGINFSPLLYVLAFLVAARMVSHSVPITHRYHGGDGRLRGQGHGLLQTMRLHADSELGRGGNGCGRLLHPDPGQDPTYADGRHVHDLLILTVALCGIITPILCTYMPLKRASEAWVRKSRKMSLLDRICVGAAKLSIGRGRDLRGGRVSGGPGLLRVPGNGLEDRRFEPRFAAPVAGSPVQPGSGLGGQDL